MIFTNKPILTVTAALEKWAAEVIAHYSTNLPPGAVEPDLDFFAGFYLDSASKNSHMSGVQLR